MYIWKKNIRSDNPFIKKNTHLEGVIKHRKWGDLGISYAKYYPDFSYQLYRSNYKNYHWRDDSLSHVNLKTFWLASAYEYKNSAIVWDNKLKIKLNEISNYPYLDQKVQPKQSSIFYFLSTELNTHLKWWYIGLDTKMLFQQNFTNNSDIVPMPPLLLRQTLYFKKRFFNNALHFLAGIKMRYFSKHFINTYSPLMSNYYLQNTSQIGNYLIFDTFFDMKVKTMRMYIEFQNLNSGWSGYDYWSSIGYPYRDGIFRVGLEWLFFD